MKTMKHTKPEFILKDLVKDTDLTISTAESCTGGMISHLITTVPGSSNYYLGSVTSYSPLVKARVLGVSPSTITNEGIVSSAVASEMAEGVRALTGSSYSVSTTGWADSYGDEREPAGTVWMAVSGPNGTVTRKFQNSACRTANIRAFANAALLFLVEIIKKDSEK